MIDQRPRPGRRAPAPAGFNGFRADAFQFLRDLGRNNRKEWFEANRDVYERELRDPMRRLVESLDARLARYRRRLDLLQHSEDGEIPMSPQYEAAVRLRRAVIDAQRNELLRWRDVGRLPDESLRALERELDHEEGLLPQR